MSDQLQSPRPAAGDCSKTEGKRRTVKVKRNTTQMARGGARQGTAGTKRWRKPDSSEVDIPMEDAQLVEHFCSSASSECSNGTPSSAGMINTRIVGIAGPFAYAGKGSTLSQMSERICRIAASSQS